MCVQIKGSEGEAYNVVSNLPKSPEKARIVEEKLLRSTLTRVHTDVEAHTTATSIAAEDRGMRHCTLAFLCFHVPVQGNIFHLID